MSMDHDDDSWNMAVGAEPEEEGRRDEDEDGSRKRSEGEGRRERGEEEGEGEGEARTSMLDLDLDSLVQLCSSQLHVTDLANMAMSCKRMRDAVSVDPIWEQQCRCCLCVLAINSRTFLPLTFCSYIIQCIEVLTVPPKFACMNHLKAITS